MPVETQIAELTAESERVRREDYMLNCLSKIGRTLQESNELIRNFRNPAISDGPHIGQSATLPNHACGDSFTLVGLGTDDGSGTSWYDGAKGLKIAQDEAKADAENKARTKALENAQKQLTQYTCEGPCQPTHDNGNVKYEITDSHQTDQKSGEYWGGWTVKWQAAAKCRIPAGCGKA